MSSKNNSIEVVKSYLDALNHQNFNAARSYLSDNMTFLSPVSSQNSADAYFKDMEQLRLQYGIEKVVYEVKKVFVDGDDVCVFFDFNIGSGATTTTLFGCGWFCVTSGRKIGSLRVIFDPRPILELSAKKK